MSLQVLNPLPSPRCSPLLSPSNKNNSQSRQQYSPQFECRCSSAEFPASAEPPQLPSAYKGPTSITPTIHRPETTYFPVSMATSKGDDLSRRVRFRPSPLPVITTIVTSVSEDKSSNEGETTKEDCTAPKEGKGEENKEERKEKNKKEDEPIESLQVPKINEIITTISAHTTSTTSTTTANHIASRFHFPNRRKSSAPIGIRVDPADFQTDVTVATATVNVVPTSDNLLANVTRKINILQRQSTIDEKNFGSKVAQDRHGRISLRPSLHVLSAIRSSLKSADDSAAPVNPLPNGVIKSSTFDSPHAPYSSSQLPSRRLTRFSTLLRASGDVSAETETTELSGGGDLNASVNEFLPDHRAVLMEVLCCCCCCSNQCCDPNGAYNSRTNGSYLANSGRSHRDSGGRGDSSNSERRRGDYSNLIENHRLARLVTFLSILAILILVFWYIGKLILEQQSGLKTNSSSSSSPTISLSSLDWGDD